MPGLLAFRPPTSKTGEARSGRWRQSRHKHFIWSEGLTYSASKVCGQVTPQRVRPSENEARRIAPRAGSSHQPAAHAWCIANTATKSARSNAGSSETEAEGTCSPIANQRTRRVPAERRRAGTASPKLGTPSDSAVPLEMYREVIPGTDALVPDCRYRRVVPPASLREGTPRPPWLYDISERLWVALDVVAAILIFFSTRNVPFQHKTSDALVLVLICSLSVVGRRKWPLASLALATLTFAALTNLRGGAPTWLSVALALVGYMVASRERRPLSIWALVSAEVVLGIAIGVVGGRGDAAETAIQSLVVLAAAWFVGDSVSARRDYLASAAEHERAAEADRSRRALDEERVRIARELHDVVAHSLAVITVQAGVGRRLMDKQPEQAGAALESIEATGRTAQDELRVVLGLLRHDDADRPELMPAPRLADLNELVESVQAAGTPVVLRRSGIDRRLSPALEMSVYRIIQEALTNVVKHAPGARATVQLDVSPGELSIEVRDTGDPGQQRDPSAAANRAGPAGSQHGILGMHERVGAFGGVLVAEPVPGQGFRVEAHIPLQLPEEL